MNCRPLAPQASTLTRLRHSPTQTPKLHIELEKSSQKFLKFLQFFLNFLDFALERAIAYGRTAAEADLCTPPRFEFLPGALDSIALLMKQGLSAVDQVDFALLIN